MKYALVSNLLVLYKWYHIWYICMWLGLKVREFMLYAVACVNGVGGVMIPTSIVTPPSQLKYMFL